MMVRSDTCRARLLEYLCAAVFCRLRHSLVQPAVDNNSSPLMDDTGYCVAHPSEVGSYTLHERWQSQLIPLPSASLQPWNETQGSPNSPSELRVAFVVLASDHSWKGNSGAGTLLHTLRLLHQPANFRFFVHIDTAASVTFEQCILAIARERTDVVIVEPRFEVTWGGSNMVSATIAGLIAAERSFQPHVVMLLGETHFPVRTPAEMLQWLYANAAYRRNSFIRWTATGSGRNCFYIPDCNVKGGAYIQMWNLSVAAEASAVLAVPVIQQLLQQELHMTGRGGVLATSTGLPLKRVLQHIRLGSQWFMLSRPFVRWLLTSPIAAAMHAFVQHSLQTPDEFFFSTLLHLSPYVSSMRNHSVTFVSPSPYRHLTLEQYMLARRQSSLFARKMLSESVRLAAERTHRTAAAVPNRGRQQ